MPYPTCSKLSEFKDPRGSLNVLLEEPQDPIRILKYTYSIRGALRGFHYQQAPLLQSKQVFLIRGAIQDVAMEINEDGQPTGKYEEFVINSQEGIFKINIPPNWAHSYLTLSNESLIVYTCDELYGNEISFNPISFYKKWLLAKDELIISKKDLNGLGYGNL